LGKRAKLKTLTEFLETEIRNMTNQERIRLYDTDLSHNKQLETQRDIFVFQCLIGCRVSDIENDRVERTTSTKDNDKYARTVCAFANDMSDKRGIGFAIRNSCCADTRVVIIHTRN
jgi:hypothetical protein